MKCSDNYYISNISNRIESITNNAEMIHRLKMDVSFEEIYFMCQNAKTIEEKQVQIEKFCKYLFGNNGDNLKMIFSDIEYGEFSDIYYIFKYHTTHDQLVHEAIKYFTKSDIKRLNNDMKYFSNKNEYDIITNNAVCMSKVYIIKIINFIRKILKDIR